MVPYDMNGEICISLRDVAMAMEGWLGLLCEGQLGGV